jgi:drug/metabolite transporter (DMT)-like permease
MRQRMMPPPTEKLTRQFPSSSQVRSGSTPSMSMGNGSDQEPAGWSAVTKKLRLGASGVGVLAFATARGHPSRLARRERSAVVLAFAGLVLLALSVTGRQELDHRPSAVGVIVWLAAAAGVAAFFIIRPTRSARAASLGLASGLLLSDGDISAKLIGYRGPWLIALASLIVAYSIGSIVLQSAYQRGDALTAAGTSTMVTSGVPIVAGFALFGETLPHGIRAAAQVAAFACLVLRACR